MLVAPLIVPQSAFELFHSFAGADVQPLTQEVHEVHVLSFGFVRPASRPRFRAPGGGASSLRVKLCANALLRNLRKSRAQLTGPLRQDRHSGDIRVTAEHQLPPTVAEARPFVLPSHVAWHRR